MGILWTPPKLGIGLVQGIGWEHLHGGSIDFPMQIMVFSGFSGRFSQQSLVTGSSEGPGEDFKLFSGQPDQLNA